MIDPFIHETRPVRVIFGAGSLASLADEVDRLAVRRVLIVSTARRGAALAHRVQAMLGERTAAVHPGAVMHAPTHATEAAMQVVEDCRADAVLAVGSGSAIGLAKAIALRTGLPQIALPATYAGSEMTPILGETRDGAKKTVRTPKIVPGLIVYDVELTLDLPPDVSAPSGMNAIAHAVEALYAPDGNPLIALLAETGIGHLARALPVIVDEPRNRGARTDALYGAWLCGTALGSVTMGLHHKLCHVLGGLFDLPHALTHAILLPEVTAHNAEAAPAAMARVARALGSEDAAAGLRQLNARLGIHQGLGDLGMPAAGVEAATERLMTEGCSNPRPFEQDTIVELLRRAHGTA